MNLKKRVGPGAVALALSLSLSLSSSAGAEPVTAASPKAASLPDEALSLKVGGVHSLKLASVSRIAIADPAVADVHVLDSGVVQVKGIKKGETTLLVWMHDGRARKSYKVIVGG